MTRAFWRGRQVLVTGHTGFKGGWLVEWLRGLGANVTGYALSPSTSPNLFEAANIGDGITSVIGDVRDVAGLTQAFIAAGPELIFHLAAQPLVRQSYFAPVDTFATNVMGTVHVLEAARVTPSVRAVVVVTTDKCYEDRNGTAPHRETDRLGGHDPYASSKACAELVTSCYRDSFLSARGVGVATARGGNVLGGGDWTPGRLVPDIITACRQGAPVRLRYPDAVRPWQHVLDLLNGYLMLAEKLVDEPERFSDAWNFGPEDSDVTVGELARRVVALWGSGRVEVEASPAFHESAILRLDSSKAREALTWRPRWSLDETLRSTVEWYKELARGRDARQLVESQIAHFEGESE
jgi:CDP-glucose 4,6-dehydratase